MLFLLQINSITQYDLIRLIIEILIIAGIGKLLSIALRQAQPIIKPMVDQSGSLVFNSLFRSVQNPLRGLIILYTVFYSLASVCTFLSWDAALVRLEKMQTIATILIVAWAMFSWKKDAQAAFMERYKGQGRSMDRATVDTVGHFLAIVIYFVTTLFILAALDVNLTTLLAVTGAGTVAAGLAAKTIIENIFSGIMLYMTRPFSIDDFISTVDKKVEGTVIEIGWYMTLIMSKERQPIYIPNSLFTSMIVVNPSRMKNRYIEFDVGIRYSDMQTVESIVNDIRQIVETHPLLENDGSGMVHFLRFASSSLDINIQAYTKTIVKKEWRDAQQDLMLKIASVVQQHGAEIAFPTHTIIMENQPALTGGDK